MSGATISFHVGSNGVGSSLAHNNRENVHGNPDIDTSRIHKNICYVKRDIQELYHEVFDEAVADYNAKQKRSDRKIDDYYKKILHDKKTEHQRELIVAIGKADDEDICFEFKRDVLDWYMKDFQERNPNLKVYNAVMHLDEANPHLHINYVPVYEASRGLAKRVGQNKAIEQQGFDSFEEWRANETNIIGQELKELGVERQYKGSHDYMRVREYKTYAKELETLRSEKNEVKSDLDVMKGELEQVRSEFSVTEKEFKKKDRKVKDLEFRTQILEEGIAKELSFDKKLKQFGFLYQSDLQPGDIKKYPVVGEVVKVEKYRELEKKYEIALEQNEKLKMSNEFNPVYQNSLRNDLKNKYDSLNQAFNMKSKLNETLTERVNELSKENKWLKSENKTLKLESRFYKKEFEEAKETALRFRGAVRFFLGQRNLSKDFNELLKEMDFKWSDGIQRAIDKFYESIRHLKPQQNQEKRIVKKQGRGMER